MGERLLQRTTTNGNKLLGYFRPIAPGRSLTFAVLSHENVTRR